jgi:hypothetical protein
MGLRMRRTARRHAAEVWELSHCHSGFVAGVAPGAVDAVLDDFVAESLVFDDAKVKVVEEGWDPSKEADALDVAGFGLIEECADEHATRSVPLGVGANNDGSDLGEVLSIDVKRGAADELVQVVFHDGEGLDVLADLCVTPGKQGAVVGEAVDELVDRAGILHLRSTCSQGSRCELSFQGEGGGFE